MKAEKKIDALGPSPNVPLSPLPFAVGEKVRFCPVNGDKDQDAEILALPGDTALNGGNTSASWNSAPNCR